MTGRSRARPRRGASISRPTAVIFHARAAPAAAKTSSSSTSARVTRSARLGYGAGHTADDLMGADGLSVVLVLGIAEGVEDDALLGGHDRPNLAMSADARRYRRPVGGHARRAARGARRAAAGRWGPCLPPSSGDGRRFPAAGGRRFKAVALRPGRAYGHRAGSLEGWGSRWHDVRYSCLWRCTCSERG